MSDALELDAARHFQEQLDVDEQYRMGFTKLANTIAGTGDDTDVGVLEATWLALDEYKDVAETVDDLADRVEHLEAENARLEQRLDGRDSERTTKEEKVADIVDTARNLREGQAVVQLTARDIVSATGVSRRYAYDLMDEDNLPSEYDWILAKDDIRQYGDLQIKKDDGSRRIGVDFEGVHSTGVDVNKFTTSNGGEGAAE